MSRQSTPGPTEERDIPRLRDLPADEDLVGASELVRAAAALPAIPAIVRQRVRARLRRTLGSGSRRGRRWWTLLRPVLVIVVALLSASVGGAAMYSVIVERRLARQSANEPTASPLQGRETKRPARGRRVSPTAETLEEPPPSAEPVPSVSQAAPEPALAAHALTDVPSSLPSSLPSSIEPPRAGSPRGESPRALSRVEPAHAIPAPLARVPMAHPRELAMVGAPNEGVSGSPSQPELTPPPLASPALMPPPAQTQPVARTPQPNATPSTLPPGPSRLPVSPSPRIAAGVRPLLPAASVPSRPETEFLADAIRLLRAGGDPDAALAALDEHTARFPRSLLAPEVAAVRIEALLRAGRSAAALAELDRVPLEGTPGHDARLVVRGELRAQRGRWREAEADFARALGTRLDGARDDLAERALWGRAAAQARLGDVAGAAETSALYLQRFPSGRFVESARRLSRLPSRAAGETP